MPAYDAVVRISTDGLREFERATKAAYVQAGRGFDSVTTSATRANQVLAVNSAAFTRAAGASVNTAAATGRYSAATVAAAGATSQLGGSVQRNILLYDGYGRALTTTTAATARQAAATAGGTSAWGAYKGGVSAVTGVLGPLTVGLGAAYGALKLIGSATEARNQIVAIERSLAVATGSAAQARTEFGLIRKETDRLGAGLLSTAKAYGAIAAAAKGTTLEGEGARRIFLAVTGAMTVLGKSSSETEGALLAVTQMMSKNSIMAEELRSQLGERMPGAVNLMARAYNVSTKELGKMMEMGQLTAEEGLPKLAAELERTFGPQIAAAAQSTRAEMNRLQTATFEFRAELGQALEPVVRSSIANLQEMTSAATALLKTLNDERERHERLNELLKEQAAHRQELALATDEQKAAQEALNAALARMGTRGEFGVALAGADPTATGGLLLDLALVEDEIANISRTLELIPFDVLGAEEVTRLETNLNLAREKAERLRAEIDETTAAMKRMATPAGAADAAIATLTKSLNDQRDELAGLQAGHEQSATAAKNAAAVFGTSATAAKALAEHYREIGKLGIDPEGAQAQQLLKLRKEFHRASEATQAFKESQRKAAAASAAATERWAKQQAAIKAATTILESENKALKAAAAAARETEAPFSTLLKHFQELERLPGITAEQADHLLQLRLEQEQLNEALERRAHLEAKILQLVEQNLRAQSLQLIERREQMPGPVQPGQSAQTIRVDMILNSEQFRAEQANAFYDLGVQWLETNGDIQKVWTETTDGLVQQFQVLPEATDTWAASLLAASALFKQLDSDAGQVIGTVLELGAAFRDLRAARAAGDTEGMGAARGRMGSAAVGFVAGWGERQGWFGGGQSRFGGRMSGNYGKEGIQAGSTFGVWGALIGGIIGSFIKKSGDQAEIVVQHTADASQEAMTAIKRADGGLSEIAQKIQGAMDEFMRGVETLIGDTLSVSGIDLSIRIIDNRIVVAARGMQQSFSDLNAALGWAAGQILTANKEMTGLTTNVKKVFESVSGMTASLNITELTRVLELASMADVIQSGVMPTEMATRMREITTLREEEMILMTKYHLVAADIIAVTNARIAAARAELESARAAVFGASLLSNSYAEIAQSLIDYNKGIDNEIAARQRAIAEAEQSAESQENLLLKARANAAEMAQLNTEAIESAQNSFQGLDLLTDNVKNLGKAGEGLSRNVGAVNKEFAIGGQSLEALEDKARRAREQAEALADSIEGIADKFSAQEIADVWKGAAAQAGTDLLAIIRQVRGAQWGSEQERKFAIVQTSLALAAQIKITEELLATTQLLDAASKAMLRGLIEEGQKALADLASGAPLAGAGGGGRREARERFRMEAEQTRLALEGWSDAALEMRRRIAELTASQQEMRRAGIGAAEAAEILADSLALLERDLLAPYREIIAAASETEFETELRQLTEGFAADLAAAAELGSEDAAAIIGEAYGIQIREQMLNAIENISDPDDWQELLETWQSFLDADLPPALRAGLDAVLAEIEEAMADVDPLAELRANLEESLIEWRNLGAGIGETQIKLTAIIEELANLRAEALAAGYSSEELARVLEDIAAGGRAAMAALGREHLGTIVSELESYGAMTPELLELQKLLTLARIEESRATAIAGTMALWAAGELRDLGVSIEELLLMINEGYDQALENVQRGISAGPEQQVGPRTRRYLDDPSVRDVVENTRDYAAELDRLLKPFEELALSPMERDLLRVEERFGEINLLLDEMSASEEDRTRARLAHEAAIDDVIRKHTEGIRRLRDELDEQFQFGQAPEQQFLAAQETFRETLTQAMGGDISAIEGFEDVARAYLAQIQAFVGTGFGAGSLIDELRRGLEDVLGISIDIPAAQTGGFISSGGLIRVHTGETILPPGVQGAGMEAMAASIVRPSGRGGMEVPSMNNSTITYNGNLDTAIIGELKALRLEINHWRLKYETVSREQSRWEQRSQRDQRTESAQAAKQRTAARTSIDNLNLQFREFAAASEGVVQ